MKPKFLEFCGINSFSEPAKIDFEKLLSGGIFGIFGDTGSGKTTILDSIVFALYGKVERARGGVGSDIINYNCDKAYVNFDFESVNDSKRERFRIEREIRKKNSLQKAELFKIEDGVITPLADGKVSAVNSLVQEIIGLSFEDFKKCIALPQGEFSQFVKAEKSDRLKLVSRLFSLEEYGEKLNLKVRDRLLSCTNRLNFFEGQLKSFEGVSREVLKEIDEKIKLFERERETIEKNYKLSEEKFKAVQTAYNKKINIEKAQKSLDELNEREGEMAEKRRALLRLSSAVLVKNTLDDISLLKNKIASEQERLDVAVIQSKSADENLEKKENIVRNENFDEKLTNLCLQLAQCEYLKEDSEKFNLKSQELYNLNIECKNKGNIIKRAESELIRLNGVKSQLDAERAELDELGEPETLLKQNFGGSLLKEEYNRSLLFFKEKLSKLRADYKAETSLYYATEKIILERIDYYNRLFAEIRTSRSPDEIFEQFKKLKDVRDKIFKDEHACEVKIAEQNNIKALAEQSLKESDKTRQRLQAELLSIKEKLFNTLGECDYDKYILSLKTQINRIELEKKELSESIEKLKREKNDAYIVIKTSEATLNILKENLNSLNLMLNDILVKNGFLNVDEAYNLIFKYPQADILQKEIEKYDEDKRSITATLNVLLNGYIPVSEEELEKTKQDYENLSKRKQNVYADIKLLNSKHDEISDKLSEKLDLQNQRDYFKNQLEILEKLRALIKGNQFMEFIASEYLSDISTAASETLLKLTSGRYFIRYNQGFFVGDNFNGGQLRSVATLSGGETFLVSLSLALALSSAIYAKSLKPIEFFFLDEGFGTLDEKLIDTVMDSLEKLKNTHFSIGLISHVEELKHRIDNKVTVIGATEGKSSKIIINY